MINCTQVCFTPVRLQNFHFDKFVGCDHETVIYTALKTRTKMSYLTILTILYTYVKSN